MPCSRFGHSAVLNCCGRAHGARRPSPQGNLDGALKGGRHEVDAQKTLLNQVRNLESTSFFCATARVKTSSTPLEGLLLGALSDYYDDERPRCEEIP